MVKTKKIIFRAETPLYEFINTFAQTTGMNRSELIRNVLVYFHMGYLMGEFKRPFKELESDFLKKFASKSKRKKFVRLFKPQKFKSDFNI